METEKLQRRTVHQSLIKTPLYAGVDKGFLIFELTTVGFLFFAIGFHLVTLLIAIGWAAVIHPLMVWISAKDPLLAVLYVRSLSAADYYAPAAHRTAPPPRRVRPSIPVK